MALHQKPALVHKVGGLSIKSVLLAVALLVHLSVFAIANESPVAGCRREPFFGGVRIAHAIHVFDARGKENDCVIVGNPFLNCIDKNRSGNDGSESMRSSW